MQVHTMRAASSLFLTVFLYNVNKNLSSKIGIGLSWVINNETIVWGDGQKFEYIKETVIDDSNGSWMAYNEFALSEHSGTHMDAPYHFNRFGWKVSEIPLSRLRVTGIIIDITEETERLGHKARLLPRHLHGWIKRNGDTPPNTVLLVRCGWSKYYSNKIKYLGGETPASYKFPGISLQAAQWIVDNRNIVGVGIDTASIDPGESTGFPAHVIFAKSYIYNLESVKIPSNLTEKGFELIVMPMILSEGTGAPVRIVAYVDD